MKLNPYLSVICTFFIACGTQDLPNRTNSNVTQSNFDSSFSMAKTTWTHGVCGTNVNLHDDQMNTIRIANSGDRLFVTSETWENSAKIKFKRVFLLDDKQLSQLPVWIGASFVCELTRRIPEELKERVVEVNKLTNRLSYFRNRILIREWNVATARTDKITPAGLFTVQIKQKCPWYFGSKGDKKVAGCAPENPLGSRALWFEDTMLGLHGTNAPGLIEEGTSPDERRLSAGCVRNKNENIEWLYDQVKIGDAILILER